MAKPFLKWVGGKTQLLPQLIPLLPKRYNKYYEPFVGGGALFFNLEAENASINDLNIHLVNVYKDVRNHLPDLIYELDKIEKEYLPLDHEGRKLFYYSSRMEFNDTTSGSIRKSGLFIFLNKTCFNGMYRENPKGEFNIPFGKNNISSLYNKLTLSSASKALKKATIQSTSYIDAIKSAKKDDFIYLDPPYIPISKTSSFTQYTGENFLHHHHKELKEIFDNLTRKGCLVMMSNSDTYLVKKMYKTYNITEVQANRFINCKPSGRGRIIELVITNY